MGWTMKIAWLLIKSIFEVIEPWSSGSINTRNTNEAVVLLITSDDYPRLYSEAIEIQIMETISTKK